MIITVIIAIKAAAYERINIQRIIALIGVLAAFYISLILLLDEQLSFLLITTSGIIFALMIPCIVFTSKKKAQIVYLSALILAVILSLTGSIQWIIEVDVTIILYASMIDMFANILMLLLCAILVKKGVLGIIFQNILRLQRHMKIILLITISMSAFLAMQFSYIRAVYAEAFDFALLGATLAVFIVLIGVMCPLLVINSLSRRNFKELSVSMEKQVQAQVNHNEAMVKMYDGQRRFQHDYNNLRLGLNNYLRNNDIEGAIEYLNLDEMSLDDFSLTYETGCPKLIINHSIMEYLQTPETTLGFSIIYTTHIRANLPENILTVFMLDGGEHGTLLLNEGKLLNRY